MLCMSAIFFRRILHFFVCVGFIRADTFLVFVDTLVATREAGRPVTGRPPPIRWCDVPDTSTPCPAVCRLHMPETQQHCSRGVGDTYLHHIWRLATPSQSPKNPETDRQFRSPWRLHCVPPTGHLTSGPMQGTTAPRRRSPSSPRYAREGREGSAFGIWVPPPRLTQWNLTISPPPP